MIDDWKIRPLGEICDVLDNKRKPITKKNRIEGDIPYYGATGILSYVEDFLFDEQLVLLGEDGAKWESGANSAFIISGKTWVNNHAHVLRPIRTILDDNWLTYNLNHQNLLPYVSGMTVPKLNQGNMRTISVPIPPLPEQKRIVAKLDQAFEAIDQAKANVEHNLQNGKDLFQSQLNEIFSQTGEGWVEKKLGECIKLKSGDGLTAKNMNPEGLYSVYGGNGIAGNHDTYNSEGMQVIIGRVGALCGNVRYLNEKLWLTDNAFKVSKFYYAFDEAFLTYLLNYKNLRSYARQAAQPVISNSSTSDVPLEFPLDVEQQKSIVSQLDELKTRTQYFDGLYNQKLDALSELKKSILQKAFIGEL